VDKSFDVRTDELDDRAASRSHSRDESCSIDREMATVRANARVDFGATTIGSNVDCRIIEIQRNQKGEVAVVCQMVNEL